ncbi:hypothetical protein Bhyg_08734, partial [Pseudolycoriella hygida]
SDLIFHLNFSPQLLGVDVVKGHSDNEFTGRSKYGLAASLDNKQTSGDMNTVGVLNAAATGNNVMGDINAVGLTTGVKCNNAERTKQTGAISELTGNTVSKNAEQVGVYQDAKGNEVKGTFDQYGGIQTVSTKDK